MTRQGHAPYSHRTDTSCVSMCMPSGTRQASTHTVQVPLFFTPAAIGAGRGSAERIVAQSIPSDPMMCVPKVTVPERTVVPPVLLKETVTFSHHR